MLIGWVLMPDHFHLLIKPEPAESTSRIMQELKKHTAQQIPSALARNECDPWCSKIFARLRVPPSVHADTRFRAWQRRYHPFGVYSEKKKKTVEKLTYMHNNPVKQRLVDSGPTG